MATPPDAQVQITYQTVVREFKNKLNNDALYAEILKTTSIDQVYKATDKLQEEQGKTGHIRHLSKIRPYLENLRDYTGTIDTFVQVKPDILALIWGPIKLLLQWTSALEQSFDAIVDTTARIGALLPEFKEAAIVCSQNPCLNDVLALFFQDILDFYVIALNFFSLTRWRYFFESMWPSRREKIKVITSHIDKHASLMRNQVHREHILEEHKHRRQALEHFDKVERSAIHQEYNAIRTHVSPVSYDDTLNRVEGRVCDGTGRWLMKDPAFCKWVDGADLSTRRLWLRGIPGSGKTFLATTVVRHVMSHGRTVLAFPSYTLSSRISALSIFHSLIFHLTLDDHDLQASLCRLGRKNLKNDLKVAAKLLQGLINCAGLVYIIIDGIDEIEEVERGRLLQKLNEVADACADIRILISSRSEVDIIACLDPVFDSIFIDNRNAGSIQTFVTNRTKEWLRDETFLPEHQAEIKGLLAPLASNAKGMFLYVEVVMNTIRYLDMEEIRDELRIPPENLDAAYLRVLKRINVMASPEADKARDILGWIGSSPTPLTIREMEQLLRVTANPGRGSRVSLGLDVVRLCGPIVEVVDDFVRFVHFTVKEYLFSSSIGYSIDSMQSTLSLAQRCIWYLCQPHHEPWLDEDVFDSNILCGEYRLHYYASTTWLELVERYLRLNGSNPLSPELVSALELLEGGRSRWGLREVSEDMDRPELQPFKMDSPGLHKLLCHTIQFRESFSSSEYHVQRSM